MTAPDMVSVIAGAIVAHLEHHGDEYDLDYSAGCLNMGADLAPLVLTAISEAGTVEWGIRYGDGDIDGGYLHKSEALTDIARLRELVRLGGSPADGNEPMTLLTRRRFEHAGPWTAVEG